MVSSVLKTVADENGMRDEGLYYVESTKRIVLMLWDSNTLRQDGFIERATLAGNNMDEAAFINRWLTDRGVAERDDDERSEDGRDGGGETDAGPVEPKDSSDPQ